MPKKLLPTGNKSSESGFTLIELMVVVAIMSIALGVAVVTIQDTRPSYLLRQEADRLNAALRRASDDALLHGHEWGVMMESGEYRFVMFDSQTHRWQDVSDPLLAKHTLPDNLVLTLESTDRLVLPDAVRADVQPAILLLSSGMTSAFILNLKDRNDVRLAVSLATDGHSGITTGEGDAKKS